jgi:pimeloyl-ACP methyl ester carboxylesterase
MKPTYIAIVFLFFLSSFNAIAQSKSFSVEVSGKGEPILLFPGFTCTAQVWEQTITAISANHECHAFTFAGFGGVPAIGTPWLPVIKDDILTYVRQKKLKNVTIIGHSLGGTLGMWLASAEPMLFKKLIAVDALPCTGALMMPNFKASDMVYDNPFSKQQLSMDSLNFRKMAQQMAAGMCMNKAKHQQLIDWMTTADRKTYVYGYVDLLKLDLREDIARIQVPVVVLAATFPSKQVVEKTWNAQLAKLPNKTIHYADNSAHFIMYDQPEWFLTKIKENL